MTQQTDIIAQSEAAVIAGAKAKNPGYNSYTYSHKKLKYKNLVPYYRHTYHARKNAGFTCNPQAILVKHCWIEYWGNGSYKDSGLWLGRWYEKMPKPNYAQLEATLKKGGFDPLDELDASTLYYLLDIHGYELDTEGEYRYTKENEMYLDGFVTLTAFAGGNEIEKRKVDAKFWFDRPNCNQPFQLKSAGFSIGVSSDARSKSKVLETKTYSDAEMKELRLQSIGRKRAEAKAKEKWESLAKIDLPKFEHFYEMAFFTKDLFLNGSKEEVESFLYHSLPSYRFLEGSEYLIDYTAQEMINTTLEKVFEGSNNFRSQYCEVMQHYDHRAHWYQFHNANESKTTKLIGHQENGTWKLKEIVMWLADDMADAACPAPIEMVEVVDKDYNFSIKMPKGYKKEVVGKAVVYKAEVHGTTYTVVANKFGEASNNMARYNQAKSNLAQHTQSLATYDEIESDWEMNHAAGREIIFLGSGRGRGGSKKFHERYRTIYLGDVNFEIYIQNLDHSPENQTFFESFKTALKGKEGESAVVKTKNYYQVGDYVLVYTGKWEQAVVTKAITSSKYSVKAYHTGKSYEAPNTSLQVDPKPDKAAAQKVVGGTTSAEKPTSYKAGDKVLVRISQTDWTPGTIKEDKGGGKYLVHCYEINEHYIQPLKNLKPNK